MTKRIPRRSGTKVIKTAIAIPRIDYQQIETLRLQMGKTRSQLLLEAFRHWMHHRDRLQAERRYVEGYRRHPETSAENAALLNAGQTLWNKESWE
jgi:lauroyl/myristoyl acyltransferase